VVEHVVNAILLGHCVYWYGNGGSAADAQHMSAELVSRFRKERKAIASVALTTDTSVLTAIGNDYSFEHIFQRQVEALVKAGDICIGLSTSGNSKNIYNAHQQAKSQGAMTVSMLGNKGGCIKNVSDKAIIIPSNDTPRVQEAHALFAHIICELVEVSCAESKIHKEEAFA
jgi:D-sedoheptulose 7-phosphate isomerase